MQTKDQSSVLPATKRPWGWQQAVIMQVAIVWLALIFQAPLARIPFGAIKSPWNWVGYGLFFLLFIVLGAIFRKKAWMRWLSGVPFAVSIIALVGVLGLLATLIPQGTEKADLLARMGFRAIFSSMPFLVGVMLLVMNLAAVTGRRLVTPRPGYLGFMLNHIGFLLVVYAMVAGASQFAKPQVQIHEGESAVQALDDNGKVYPLGAKVTLNRFEIEKYPPKLAIQGVEGEKSKLINDHNWVKKGGKFAGFGYQIEVLDYLPVAFPDDKAGWVPSDHGLPAAKLHVTGPKGFDQEAWVAAGLSALGIPNRPASLDDHALVGLVEAMPKSYRSHLTIEKPGHKPVSHVLAVNHPVRLGHWLLFQSSYDMTMEGRVSIIEAVKDPALPIVYTGMICMVLGAILVLWLSPKRRLEIADETETA